MANIGTTATNVSGIVGKWTPYYYKPFMLGRILDGEGSTDGQIYISQTSGVSNQVMEGSCTSSYNCNFYYTLTFTQISSVDYFDVKKYTLDGTLVDTIYASGTSGDARYWKLNNIGSFTIDVGVNVMFPVMSAWENGDIYKITLPTFDVMERRKIYHGGYSTFLRLAYTEGIAYHSDIIPTNLKGKNISIIYNPPNGLEYSGDFKGLQACISKVDIIGNESSTLMLEWNANKDGLTEDVGGNASDTAGTYPWSANETWSIGTVFAADLAPNSTTDFPAYSSAASSDVSPTIATSGTQQIYNATVSGRAGYARFKTSYEFAAGDDKTFAYNQYWPVIITLS